MAVNFNLIPKELLEKSGVMKIETVIKRLTAITLPLLLVFIVLLFSFYFLFLTRISKAKERLEEVKGQVKVQETTEQKLVLVKDRLSKVKLAKNSDSASSKIAPADNILSFVPLDATVSELSLEPSKTGISVVFQNVPGVSAFFKGIAGLTNYKEVKMTNFGFNPTSGYAVSLEFK